MRPYFDAEAIEECLAKGPNYEDKYYEDTIREDETEPYYQGTATRSWNTGASRCEVGQRSGYRRRRRTCPSSTRFRSTSGFVGGWFFAVFSIRSHPARIPYQVFPYEINPYQIWGVGVAENMEDAQMLMNGHVRMAIDNLALAGNLVFDVDEAVLVPGQNMDIFPGKIFRRQSGVTGTAINGLKFPNTAGENIQMYQISRQLADEETGIPSIMHGQTGVTGTGRTAAGLSMLMGGAGLSMKTVIKNIDDHLLKPLGEAYFQWNMQFNDDSRRHRRRPWRSSLVV